MLPTALLSRFARRSVTVALTGDGADELFAGVDPFSALSPARLYYTTVPCPLHTLLRGAVARLPTSDLNISLDFKLKRNLAGLDGPPRQWNPVWLGPLDPQTAKAAFEAPLKPDEVYSEAFGLWETGSHLDLVDRTLQFYTTLCLQDDILAKVDRAAMMSSLAPRPKRTRALLLKRDIGDYDALASRCPTPPRSKSLNEFAGSSVHG